MHPRDGGATGGAPPIGLVVTDLDGSLWDVAGRIHPSVPSAIERVRARGVPVLAATARRPASAFSAMADNEVLLPAVLFDGSLGRDFLSGTDFVRHLFDARSAERVLAAFVDAGLEPCLNIDHPTQDFVLGEHPSTRPEHMAFNVERTRCCELVGAARSLPVFTFSVCGVERALLAPVLHAVGGFAQASITPDGVFGGHSLSVRPLGVSKWTGVLAYCAAHGLDPEAVLAVGDGENDLELLAAASIACVPEDGCEAALALATHRIGSATAGGWTAVDDLLG